MLDQTRRTNFRRLWLASGLSNISDGLYQLALPLLLVGLTRAPLLIAGLNIVLGLPWLVFSLKAGQLVDRSDRRNIMLWTNGLRGVSLLVLTLGVATGQLSVPLLYLIAFALGIGETLVDTALTTIVPAVTARADLTQANAKIETAVSLSNQFLAPPLSGWLLGFGFWVSPLVSAACSLTSVGALLGLRGSYRAPDAAQQKAVPQALTAGLRTLSATPLLRDLTLFTAAMNLCWAMWGAVQILYMVAPGPVGLNAFEYGLLMTGMALGGVIGAASCAALERRFGCRLLLWLDVIGTAALVGLPALTPHPGWIAFGMFLAGFGASLWRIVVATIRQHLTPDHLLGQVYTASRFLSWGVGPFGALLAGTVAARYGTQTVFLWSGLLAFGLTALFFPVFPARRLVTAATESSP